jgi:hypothetical protein
LHKVGHTGRARMPTVWIWKGGQCTHCVWLSCLSL